MELQWPLILFTTLVAWSAGVFGTQAVLALRGEAPKAQLSCWITAAVLLAAGGIAVFFHLEHFERIFNGFGHLTSGITQELIAIVVLAVAAIVYLVYLRRDEGKRAGVAGCALHRAGGRARGGDGPLLHDEPPVPRGTRCCGSSTCSATPVCWGRPRWPSCAPS